MSNKYYKIVHEYFKNADIARNNANFIRSISNLEGIVIGEVMKDYFFDVITGDIPVKSIHNEGWAYLHQTFKISPYSYAGDNVIFVKIGNETKTVTFEELYEMIDTKEEKFDEIANYKNVNDIYVYDIDGLTKIKRITKKKNNKAILKIKLDCGYDIKVTSDHPMIISNDKSDVIPADKIKIGEHKQKIIYIDENWKARTLWSKVKDIEIVDEIHEYVYDITTESETFLCNNIWVHNCIGLSSKDISMFGLRSNAKNERASNPPKRLETLFAQCANLICLISQEVSGATSLNDISTIGAAYLYVLEKEIGRKYEKYDLVNIWEEFLFNINLPFRTGSNSPFSNITLEFGKPNPHLANEYVVFGGEVKPYKYSEIPSEYYDRIVDAFIDAMSKGDADGRPFTFPLITVNIYDNFEWDNPMFKKLLDKSEYFGGLYFQNYLQEPFNEDTIYKKLNPYIEPFDIGMIYSNCCYYPSTKFKIYDKEDKVISFEEFFDKYKGELIDKVENDYEWYDVDKEVYAHAFNLENGEIGLKKISKVLKKYSDHIYTIVLSNDTVIKCDKNHPVIVFDGSTGKYKRKFAYEITTTDIVPIIDDNNNVLHVSVVMTSVMESKGQVFYDVEVEDWHTLILENNIVGSNCRMTFNIEDVLKYTGSNPFHSNSGVGGIGVYNINMNRILFLSKDNFEMFCKLFDYIYDIGVKTLQRKRQFVREHWEDLYPYLSYYQKTDRSLFNIFSVVGTHEGLINAGFKDGIKSDAGKEYALKIAKYIREKIEKSIEQYGELFSLEYAPSENAACKLAEKDLMFAKKAYDYVNGKPGIMFSSNTYLDETTKFIINYLGKDLFDKVAI